MKKLVITLVAVVFATSLFGQVSGNVNYQNLSNLNQKSNSPKNENLLLTVEQVSARRIRKVRALWLQKEEIEARKEDRVNGRTTG